MATLKMGSTTVLTDTTLANAVQDNVTRLGTVTSGTLGAVAKGTVTESGGTPTGAILERGSNANGEYTKYADGALICNIQDISSDSSAGVTWTFPHAFVTGYTPACIGTGSENADRVDVGGHASDPLSNTAFIFFCYYLTEGSSGRSSSKQSLSAIGRWY